MPFSAAGELTFAAEFDIGELGPSGGEPVAYSWPWTNHLWALLPLALLLPLLLLRRNRNRSVAAILVPTIALYFLWVPFVLVMGDGIGNLEMMAGMVAVGLGAVCLLAPWLGTGNRWRTWGLALLVAGASEGLTFLSFTAGYLEAFPWQGPLLVVPVAGTGIVITSVVLAAHTCRERSGGGRFLLMLVVWAAVLVPPAILVPIALVEGPGTLLSEFDEISIGVLVFGIACLALAVPFLLLAGISKAHRERFRVALGL